MESITKTLSPLSDDRKSVKEEATAYEKKMHVDYETFSKKVSIYFRGQRKVLPTEYNTREEGILAGENFCRENGWEG